MLKTDEFWLYAREAILSASCAKSEDEKRSLLDLAGTWTQAALLERHLLADHDKTNITAYGCLVRGPSLPPVGDSALL